MATATGTAASRFRRCDDQDEVAQRHPAHVPEMAPVCVVEAVPQRVEPLLRHLSRTARARGDDAFMHLKRVRKERDDTQQRVRTLVLLGADEHHHHHHAIDPSFFVGSPHMRKVPARAPLTREQHELWSARYWPMAFRPPAFQPPRLAEDDAARALRRLAEVRREAGALLVDPTDGCVVARASGRHAALRCVDAASRVLRECERGGRQCCRDGREDERERQGRRRRQRLGYMLTGFDLYTHCEPCVMCSMALTHSRIRRVFFAEAHAQFGGVLRVGVHRLKALNHRYEVYQQVA